MVDRAITAEVDGIVALRQTLWVCNRNRLPGLAAVPRDIVITSSARSRWLTCLERRSNDVVRVLRIDCYRNFSRIDCVRLRLVFAGISCGSAPARLFLNNTNRVFASLTWSFGRRRLSFLFELFYQLLQKWSSPWRNELLVGLL